MSIVTDFKSIRRKLEKQEQKVEFEEKNPKPPEWYNMSCLTTADSLPAMFGWIEEFASNRLKASG